LYGAASPVTQAWTPTTSRLGESADPPDLTVRRLDPATNVISEYRVPTLGGTPVGVLDP